MNCAVHLDNDIALLSRDPTVTTWFINGSAGPTSSDVLEPSAVMLVGEIAKHFIIFTCALKRFFHEVVVVGREDQQVPSARRKVLVQGSSLAKVSGDVSKENMKGGGREVAVEDGMEHLGHTWTPPFVIHTLGNLRQGSLPLGVDRDVESLFKVGGQPVALRQGSAAVHPRAKKRHKMTTYQVVDDVKEDGCHGSKCRIHCQTLFYKTVQIAMCVIT